MKKFFLTVAVILALFATAQAQEVRYEFEKAVITTKAEVMGQPLITTFYIDDYGKKEAAEFTMDMSAMGGNKMQMRIVNQKDCTVTFDVNGQEGLKRESPVNFLNLTPEIIKKHKINEKGEEVINGRPCKIYTWNTEAGSATVWIWKGFTVKSVEDRGIFTIETTMDTFDENGKIPDGIFNIPDGIKIR